MACPELEEILALSGRSPPQGTVLLRKVTGHDFVGMGHVSHPFDIDTDVDAPCHRNHRPVPRMSDAEAKIRFGPNQEGLAELAASKHDIGGIDFGERTQEVSQKALKAHARQMEDKDFV